MERNAMRRDLMDILACPECKGPLELRAEEEDGEEVVKGILYCSQCQEEYPIVNSIPNLLPPNLRS